TIDNVEHAGRNEIADQVHEQRDRRRGLYCWFQYDAVSAGDGRCDLPRSHKDREVPGDDLPDDAQWFVIVIRDRVVIDLRQAAFLGANGAGEIAQVIDG